MSNIHGLNSLRDAANNNDDSSDEGENRYVGGVDGRGGGSGLAVQPNPDGASGSGGAADAIFGLAGEAASDGTDGPVRRTITMYQSGFVVDNGPYRRLDDRNNAEFLTSLARGVTPRELARDDDGNELGGDVTVGLVDRRGEEYDAERHAAGGGGRRGGGASTEPAGFRSFSGEGQSLGGGSAGAAASTSAGGVIDPSSNTDAPEVDASRPSTSVAVRLVCGKRLVVKINLDAPVSAIGAHIHAAGPEMEGPDPYVLTGGYPPRPIENLGQTVEEAGLKGAQVVQKKA